MAANLESRPSGVSSVSSPANTSSRRLSRNLSRQSTNPHILAAQSLQAPKHPETHHGATAASTPEQQRTIPLAAGAAATGFTSNGITTSKYNLITFLPRFLFEMFSRLAYLYFLLQAILSWWSVVSPFGGTGSTLALGFVLVVAAVKAVWEDVKRHQEDYRTNNSKAHKVKANGETEDLPWRDVKVGQVVQIRDDELFPADVLCLSCALPDKVCFIKTTNLDGETNLKIKRPVDLKGDAVETYDQILRLEGTLYCEVPNPNMNRFNGKLEYTPPGGGAKKTIPITMNEMLLRGCMLKNTGSVVGLVVYTGQETRIQMNAAKPPLKIGSFDHFLNLQIALIVLLQLVMCIFCAIASLIWREQLGKDRYFLALYSYTQGNYSNNLVYVLILFVTFWILYSYLVPISLFVTLEIVKFWQGFVYMNSDAEMIGPGPEHYSAMARNSSLNEDLGKVSYVFSDKTGTLTSNEMQLRALSIKGVTFGDVNFKLEDHADLKGEACLQEFDRRLSDAAAAMKKQKLWAKATAAGGSPLRLLKAPTSTPAAQELEGLGLPLGSDSDNAALALGHHLVDYWTNLLVCHSLIVEPSKNGGPPIFQGPSPDEVALVEAARQLGFEFVSRSQAGVTLRLAGEEVVYEVLNVLEYSSERARMSVIARAPDDTVRLFCKGADAKVLSMIRKDTPAEVLEATKRNLHLFATQGLRTLLLATKVLTEDEYDEFDEAYQAASTDLNGRDRRLAELAAGIEANLELVGVTAIEDKLQGGVPEAIETMLNAGIRVWVITGDKQETAINIAISCKLIRSPDSLMICNAESTEEAGKVLKDLWKQVQDKEAAASSTALPHHAANTNSSSHTGESQRPLVGGRRAKKLAKRFGKALVGELVIDGKSLDYILKTELEPQLALLGSRCGSVVICRASPAQKASIVKMMRAFELAEAVGSKTGIAKFIARTNHQLKGKMLAIGDGANDVAMIQAADVGIGIMGKEGRQAVNNSDYAVAQFRFLVRLLLVHGQLSHYRLAKLVKYSFYKNIIFAFMLFYFQFYCGFSGQSLVDDITAAVYNVIFTALPILLFSVLDRPVKYISTLMRFPQMYNTSNSLSGGAFWRTGVILAIFDAALAFFIPYYAITAGTDNSLTDVYSAGKTVFTCILGTVTIEVMLQTRYWTWVFGIFSVLSYLVVYLYFWLYPLFLTAINSHSVEQTSAGLILSNPTFWFLLLTVNACTAGRRLLDQGIRWVFFPQDNMILAEHESQHGEFGEAGWQAERRLGVMGFSRNDGAGPGDGAKPEMVGGNGRPGVMDEEKGLSSQPLMPQQSIEMQRVK